MSNFGKFIGGLLIGGAVGGLLGVLLAPTSGEDTRKKIADNTSNAYKKAGNSLTDVQHKANKKIEELQHTGQDVMDKITDKFSCPKEEVVNETTVIVENNEDQAPSQPETQPEENKEQG